MRPTPIPLRPALGVAALVAITCLAQEVRITSLNGSGDMGYELSPTGTVSDYSCWAEWCPTLRDNWTNAWHQPFAPYVESAGVCSANLPRFFRVVCAAGLDQGTNGPAWTDYTVTGEGMGTGKL